MLYNKKRALKKKFFLFAFYLLFFASGWGVLIWPKEAFSQVSIPNPLKATSLVALFDSITNFLLWVAIPLTTLIIVVGGYYFVTAAGDPEKIKTGKKIILYTVIGLLIIAFSKGVIQIIKIVSSIH